MNENEERDYDSITIKQVMLGWNPYILVTIDRDADDGDLEMSLGRDVTPEAARALFRMAKRGIRQAERQMRARFRKAKREARP